MNSTRTLQIRTRPALLLALAFVALIGMTVQASSPSPELLQRIKSGEQQVPYYLVNLAKMHARGINTGTSLRPASDGSYKIVPSKAPQATGTFKALAIMVQFSDNSAATPAAYFDSLLFDSTGNTVRDYYHQISYGQLDMITVNMPTSLGWRTAPQTYAYYVDNQNGTGSYPNNCQKLVEDMVDQVDSVVDFSKYDNDGDGFVDVVVLIHAGSGAEMSGLSTDIWSHKWAIVPRLRDGVYISDYTVQPELWTIPGDMTIGVYAHELGHAFGLPDLYDTDNSSNGIGIWGIMAYGSWMGPGNRGGSPSHPCAWSRIQMGFATAINVAANSNGRSIRAVETSGEIYRLWSSGAASNEYFLVENRQKTGYDSYLYGSGLLIWHIDDSKATSNNTDNTQEWYPGMAAGNHYRVALEQADGLYEIEKSTDYGDGNDPWPGGLTRRDFDATTTPSSDAYLLGTSFVKVGNISNSGATMTADLIVGLAAAVDDDNGVVLPTTMALEQNYPNPFNPTTTIGFTSSAAARARLEIFDLLGRRVRTLLDGAVEAGTTTLVWDGRDDADRPVASGVYFYRLTANDSMNSTKKMLLVK